jgi:hypothetical protein
MIGPAYQMDNASAPSKILFSSERGPTQSAFIKDYPEASPAPKCLLPSFLHFSLFNPSQSEPRAALDRP